MIFWVSPNSAALGLVQTSLSSALVCTNFLPPEGAWAFPLRCFAAFFHLTYAYAPGFARCLRRCESPAIACTNRHDPNLSTKKTPLLRRRPEIGDSANGKISTCEARVIFQNSCVWAQRVRVLVQQNRPKRKLKKLTWFNFRFALPRKPEPCGKIFLHTFLISKKYVPARHEGKER